MKISDFQRLIEDIYFEKDSQRGMSANFMWLVEEIGELSRALSGREDRQNLEEEFADVFAWLCTLASMKKVDMEEVVKKYAKGCPRCKSTPCQCS